MKKISFVVPCFNSESYMQRAIDSLLVDKESVEIIIVNDGSTDNTLKIANKYLKKYPKTIKVIDKENGGHGSAVNIGLKNATGLYFKVVDSDDWLDKKYLKKLLKEIDNRKKSPDLIICNYVYDHLYENKQKVMKYDNIFKAGKITNWNEIKHIKQSQYMIMHSLIYKTEILKKSKLVLPEHTFYVDNIVAYWPLPYIKTILYLDYDLYHYFIGRSDQSVNEDVMINRVDQQIKVTKIITSCANLDNIKKQSKKLYKYMVRNISMMITISSIYLLMKGDKESYQKRKELWKYTKEIDKSLYHKLRCKTLAGVTYIFPGKIGGFITLKGYKIAKRVYKFN